MNGAQGGSWLQRGACAVSAATGLWSLGSWWIGRPELAGLLPGTPPVLPGPAVWMLLVAGALPLGSSTASARRMAMGLSGLSLGVALLQLTLLLAPGGGPLPVPNALTGASMTLVSLALLLRDRPWRRQLDPSGSLALLAMVAPYFALMGYALRITALYRPANAHEMALPTALVLILTAMATLASRPQGRWMAWWSQESVGGSLLRRQVPAILLAPFLLGMLAVAGEQAHLYSHGLTIGLLLVIAGLAGTAHSAWTAHSLDALEAARADALRDLQASEAMFRGLMEGASDAIMVIDEQGRIAFKNRQAGILFGYEPGELFGATIDQLVPERFREAHAMQVGGYMRSPRRRSLDRIPELVCRRKDGSEFPAEISLSPLETIEGRFVMVLLRDLTERQKTAQAIAQLNAELRRRNEEIEAEIVQRTRELARQSELIQRTIHHVPAGIAMVDAAMTFRWANAEYARQLGMGLDQLLERRVQEVLPGFDAGLIDLEALRSGQLVQFAGAPLTRGQVTSYWDASLVPLFEEGVYQGFIVLTNEVTARLELERMQQDHIEALERADALKDEFLNIVSHELRTPIAILSGTISLFEYEVDGPLSAHQRRDVARMRESTDHLLTLVNDLLDMSMIQAGRLAIMPKPLQVGDLIEGAIDFVQPLATERRIAIRTDLDPDPPPVTADAQRIRQVLINLLSNALKYSPMDSTVTLRVHSDEAGLRCEVQDEGSGVPHDDRDRIFEKFTRLPGGSEDGAGLGLYICRALIDAHRGEIGVESDGKTGSTFWFTLPIAR